ncbi:antibiotic biosynthesis monooxygenase family protein [Sphingosinithalassobacter portus]|uniref:antibiotic biosynthesis monooxygenase family protein n=1 Tax=Stakelama portus TaxID=2676234 RepID=UPI00137A4CDE|nr:antibiotic biosynthesis monooxygenase [Sphingosinithalassobacter portus]
MRDADVFPLSGLGRAAQSQPMVFETNIVRVAPADMAAFETAFAAAAKLIREAPGCRNVRLIAQVEAEGSYWVIIGWRDLEDHLVAYAQSDRAARVRDLIAPFIVAIERGHGKEVALT